MSFLQVDDIHTYYGNIQALKGVSLTVEEGECVTLIGSNGAGKSTTLRSISGLTAPRSGTIKLAGDEIQDLPPQEIVGLGICQSPEGRKCFQRMTVRENLELGAFLRRDSGGIEKDLARVFELFPRLDERQAQKAGTMSSGGVREISWPSKRTEPLRAGVNPEIDRSVVDLPAPLEPISVTHSPSSTVSETPFRAWMLP